MSETGSDMTVPLEEVLQEEQQHVPMTPIPVVVEGPTRVVSLPAEGLILGQVDVDNTAGNAVRLFGKDPRRQRLTMVASGGAMRVATSQRQCVSGNGAVWPVGVPFVITAFTEVWVAAASGSATTINYSAEQWTG